MSKDYVKPSVNLRELSVSFTDTAEEEIVHLVNEMHLVPIAENLVKESSPVLKEHLTQLLAVISDLFSVSLPAIEKSPEVTLRAVSRDINLSRLLRERGLFRLYRLLHHKEGGVPMFMGLINPATGSPFVRQEEFIGWFCEEAHVARSLVFMRLAAIDRLQTIGFDLEGAFSIVVSKPYAVQDTLHKVASWDKGEIKKIDPDVAIQLARKFSPEYSDEIETLANAARDDFDAEEVLNNAMKPVLVSMMEEVAATPRAKDATRMVQDALLQPIVDYEWDRDTNVLLVHYTKREFDPKTRMEITTTPTVVPFVPDVLELPDDIVDDLFKRLPIRNKYDR
jgi:hypothetical protein